MTAKRPCTQCGKSNAVPPKRLCPTCARVNKKESAARAHAKQIEAKYGISAEDYAALAAWSGGKCFICGGGSGKRLAVDHDHKKEPGRGSVRGLLCQPCNTWLLARLGKDSAERIAWLAARAVAYLNDPPAPRILKGNK